MCFVEHVKTKSLMTFQPIEFPVLKTVKCVMPAVTCTMLNLNNEGQRGLFLVEMKLAKKAGTQLQNVISFVEEFSPPITLYLNQP